MDKKVMEQALEQVRTPFYLFDMDDSVKKIRKLKATFGPNVDICYAMKANPFLAGGLSQAADYFEVCSPGEFRICERAGVPMEKIVLSGVYKDKDDIEAMLAHYKSQGTYTVESLSQWNLLESYARGHRLPIHILLRLTNGSQFGLEREEISRIIGAAYKNGLMEVDGIQFFSGTQKKSTARMREELQRLDAFLLELYDAFRFVPKKLEYGPGFPVDYFGDNPQIEDTVINILSEELSSLRYTGRVVLEIGREIAAPCGSYVTKVVDIKRRGEKRFCIVDGGTHQINYYGQIMAMKTPPVTHWDHSGEDPISWTVFGSLCSMNDVLVREHPFSGLHLGSRFIFEKAGAYSATESMALFLSHDLPQVVLYSGQNGFQLARGQIQTDVLNSMKQE